MFRVISRLDVKNENLINTVNLEGLRVVGQAKPFASQYYENGADEIIFNDLVASLYGRNTLDDLIKQMSESVFVPMTVVGGIRSIKDAERVFKSGADKIGINSAALENPPLLFELVREFGSQAIVLSIEFRIDENGIFFLLTDGGREKNKKSVVNWLREAQDKGVGEILATAVHKDGKLDGFDTKFVEKFESLIKVPLIISGGAGSIDHCLQASRLNISGISLAGGLHTKRLSIKDIKERLLLSGVEVRL